MKYLAIIIALLYAQVLTAQIRDKYTSWALKKGGLTFTATSGGQIQRYTNPQTNETRSFNNVEFLYRLGMNLNHNMNIGVLGFHGFISGNMHPNFSYQGIGGYARYYFMPTQRQFNSAGWDSSQVRRIFLNRIKLFAEGGFLRTNHLPNINDVKKLDRFSNNILYLAIGTHVRIWRGVAVEYGFRTIYLPNRESRKIVIPKYADLGLAVYF